MKNILLSLVLLIPSLAWAQAERVAYTDEAGKPGFLQMETFKLKDSTYYTFAENKEFAVGMEMTAFLAINRASGVVYIICKSQTMLSEMPFLTLEYGWASTSVLEPLKTNTKQFRAEGKNGGNFFLYTLNLSADPILPTLLKAKKLFFIFHNPETGFVETENTVVFTSHAHSAYRPESPRYFREQLKNMLTIQK